MGVIQVRGPKYDRSYSINIAGNQPTPQEQQRIDQFVQQQELELDQYIQRRTGGSSAEESSIEPVVPQDKLAVTRGFQRQPFERQRSFGVAEEALADTAFGRLLGFDAEEAKEKQEEAEAELARLEREDPSVGFRDIEGVGTAASFAGEQIGSEARDLGIQTAATLGGAIFGPGGALVGRAGGVGYTTAMAAPELFAEAIEKQKEAGEEISLGKALGATAANLVSEFVVDYFLVGKLLKPIDAGKVKRALVEGGKGAGVEGAQEVSQSVVNRLQAGLPIDSQEALMEYAEAFAGGASVGGPFAGGASVLAGRDTQLDDDIDELYREGAASRSFVEKQRERAADRELEEGKEQGTLEISKDEEPLQLPSPETFPTAPDEFENKPFTKQEYESVAEIVKSDVEAGRNINITTAHKRLKEKNPELKVSQARDLVNNIVPELQARGVIVENTGKGPKFLPRERTDSETQGPYLSYRKKIIGATRKIKANERKADNLKQNLDSVAEYGRDLNGKRGTEDQLNRDLAETERVIEENKKIIDFNQEKLRSIGEDTFVPTIESVGLPNNMKAVPIPEATEAALQPRYEAQQQSIKGLKSQLSGIIKQIKKLNQTATKRQLSSIELDRMDKLQNAQAEVSGRLGDAQANLKTPAKIIQEAKGEQFREQQRQRDIENKKAAARARAVDDQAQQDQRDAQPSVTPEFSAVQDRVFSALRKRLDKLGFKNVKLERTQDLIQDDQGVAVAEGAYNPQTRAISLSMGVYDPNLSEQQYFDKLKEVMNHELIHAARDLNVLTKSEYKTLASAASKLKYVKQTVDGLAKRNYSYLDRSKKLNPELNADQQKEEAVAEMFRDYVAGRLSLAGKPRSLMEKIKRFFRGITGTLNDQGFSSVESIFGELRSGQVAERNKRFKQPNNPSIKKSKVLYSRIIPLSPDERAASILDYLDPKTGKPIFSSPPGSETLVSFARRLLGLRGTRKYDVSDSPEDREIVARIMAAEAEAALLSSNDAIGWYDSKLKLAKKILFPIYPEVSPTRPDGTPNPAHDPASEHAFDYATAVTSNGLSVIDNYLMAARQYEAWRSSDSITPQQSNAGDIKKFPVTGSGAQGQSMLKAFEFWNALSDRGYDSNQIADLLTTQMARGDLNKIMMDIFDVERVADLPFTVDGKELASEKVGVAYVIGPKIGNGFYQNLRGNFDPLTMDRWWMRFFNRITGNPIVDFNPELIEKNRESLWNLVSNPDDLSSIDKKLLERTLDRLQINNLEKSDIELLAPEIMKTWDKEFYNKAFNDKLEELETQYEFTVDKGTVRGKDAEIVKEIARGARPESTPLSLAGKNLAGKIKLGLQEDPRNATDRAAMRATANRARQILKEELNVDLNNADFQALMWYAEKRIFEAGGVRKGRGDDNDYADGAIAILKEKGVSDDKIKATLPESERGRLNPVKSQLATDATVDRQADRIQGEPKQGDFFAPRELELADESEAPQNNLSQEQLAQLESEPLTVPISRSPQLYSRRIPSAEQMYPVAAPVGGPLNAVYGIILENGRPRKVILPKGNHEVYESGAEVGQGLYHIQQRGHDRELVENSKYKRVEKAIFDLLKRWEKQGYQDDTDVISYRSGDNLVLEWRNNLESSSPPLKLVLQDGRDDQLSNAPLRSAYYVKTFYPLLEKKDRAKPLHRGIRAINSVRSENRRLYSRLLSTTAQPRNTVGVGPEDLERRMRDLRYTGMQDKVASVFNFFGKPFNVNEESVKDSVNYVFRKLQDQFAPVGAVYDKLRKGGADIARDMDAYFQELGMHGIVGEKKDQFSNQEFNPVIEEVARMDMSSVDDATMSRISGYYKQMKEKNGSPAYALANSYLYAKHALERNARILRQSRGKIENGSGMSNEEANNIIAFVNGMNPIQQAVMNRTLNATRNIISKTNDVYIEGGLIPDYKDDADIDDATRDAFKQYEFYVPLRGFADPEESLDIANYGAGGASGRKFGGGRPNRTPLGRSSYAGDIINNVGVQRLAAIDKAEKNKVGQAFLRLLESDDIDTTGIPAYVRERHPLRRIMRNGTITHMPDRNFNDPNDPILAVRVGGEEVLIGFDDTRLANALKGTSTSQANAFLGGLHSLTRLYANLLTSWNPAFILSNLPRDIETAAFNAQQYGVKNIGMSVLKKVAPAGKAIMKVVNNKEGADPYWANRYKEFKENGGANVLNQMASDIDNAKDIKKTINKIVEADAKGNRNLTKQLWVGTKKGTGSIINYVEAMNTAAENSVRLAFFDKMVLELEGQGVPKERALKEAAIAARQLTTNFAKGGELKYGLNTFYLFFNASLQGSMAMLNSLVNNKRGRQLVGSVVAMGFTMDWINALMSGDEDEDGILDYDDLNEYKLAHSIVLPDLNGDGTFVTIPLAYGINMFYNLGRSMANITRGAYGHNGTHTPAQAASSTLGTVVETINPFGGNNLETFLSPTVGDPVVELMSNENFMNGPIYKELSPYEQYKSRSGLYWSTTSPSAIAISKFLNDNIGGGDDIIPGTILGDTVRVDIQPDVIEHLVDFMLGGVGRFVVQTGETVARSPEILMGEFQKDMIRRTPIINKAFTAVTDKDRSGSFYEKRNDVLAVAASIKNARDNRDVQAFNELRSRYPDIIRLIEPVKKINSVLRKINKRRKAILQNKNLSEKRRKELLEKIDERKALLISRANVLMRDI
jgi:hypothetical protein